MSRGLCLSWVLLLGACSASQPSAANTAGKGATHSNPAATPAAGGASVSNTSPTLTQPSQPSATNAAGGGAVVPMSNTSEQPLNCNQLNSPFKVEGCACTMGQTAPCWTGPVADRNVGACHDGLQVCEGTAEFASWGKCMGEELNCPRDAGVPDEPEEECACIPGAVIQCSEDCTTGIICSLTATKTCLPDGTWTTCREEGAAVDAPGFQCRNMLHGCLDETVQPDGNLGQGEIFVGDCSKQFKCGHAPPPPPPPVLPE